MFLVKPYRVWTALDLREYQDLLDMMAEAREPCVSNICDGVDTAEINCEGALVSTKEGGLSGVQELTSSEEASAPRAVKQHL